MIKEINNYNQYKKYNKNKNNFLIGLNMVENIMKFIKMILKIYL